MYILTKPMVSQGKRYRIFFEKKLDKFAGVQSTFNPTIAKKFESREEANFFVLRYLKGLKFRCTLLANEVVSIKK